MSLNCIPTLTTLTSIVLATSSSDNSVTTVRPWVIFGSPLGPVSETNLFALQCHIAIELLHTTRDVIWMYLLLYHDMAIYCAIQ